MALLRNAIFCHPERSEGSYQRRDSSAFGLRMTESRVFRNSPLCGILAVCLCVFSGVLVSTALNFSLEQDRFLGIITAIMFYVRGNVKQVFLDI